MCAGGPSRPRRDERNGGMSLVGDESGVAWPRQASGPFRIPLGVVAAMTERGGGRQRGTDSPGRRPSGFPAPVLGSRSSVIGPRSSVLGPAELGRLLGTPAAGHSRAAGLDEPATYADVVRAIRARPGGSGGAGGKKLASLNLVPRLRRAFAGYGFPPEVTLAFRWYLRFGLSYLDVESSWPSAASRWTTSRCTGGSSGSGRSSRHAARPRQHVSEDRWRVDEMYLRVGGTRRYLFRAIDQFGQVIDVFLSPRRDGNAARGSSGERSATRGSLPSRSPLTGTASTPRPR